MKRIMILPYEDRELKQTHKYIILKKNKTIIKNNMLLNNPNFLKFCLDDRHQAGKMMIEEWENCTDDTLTIVCGDNGEKLVPVHVSSMDTNAKLLFQTEFNTTIKINFSTDDIEIHKNIITEDNLKIKSTLIYSLNYNTIWNVKTDEHSLGSFYQTITRIYKEMEKTKFKYIKPLWFIKLTR